MLNVMSSGHTSWRRFPIFSGQASSRLLRYVNEQPPLTASYAASKYFWGVLSSLTTHLPYSALKILVRSPIARPAFRLVGFAAMENGATHPGTRVKRCCHALTVPGSRAP